MDKIEQYRHTIEAVFNRYAAIPYSLGDIVCETIFDRAQDKYLMITLGRDQGKRVHFAVAHIDIRDGKLWIQTDRTEDGVTGDLLAAGIPKEDIVLAFMSAERRQHTEFAVA